MLVGFPDPYFDETFYSLCARFTDHGRYPQHYTVIQKLFGTPHIKATIDFPSQLDYFLGQLPPQPYWTLNNLLENHTFLPYFTPFLDPNRLTTLKYCPLCVEADRKTSGEAYWHRAHQLAGVEVCYLHQAFLEHSPISTTGSNRFVSAETVATASEARLISSENIEHRTLLDIAQNSAWLVQHPLTPSQLENLRNKVTVQLWFKQAKKKPVEPQATKKAWATQNQRPGRLPSRNQGHDDADDAGK
jgi:hypothetical protein